MTLTDASLHCAGEQNSSLNGGKKTMLLAVYQAPQTYSNLKALFTLLNVCLRLWLESYQHGYWTYLTFQQTPLPVFHVRSDTVGPRRTLRTIPMNSEHPCVRRTTSGKKIENKYFFNCLNPPLLYSNLAIPLLCPPPPAHLKLGIVNLSMRHLFSPHPHFEKEVALTLGKTGFLILLYTLIPIIYKCFLQIKLSALVFGCGWSAGGKWVINVRIRRNNWRVWKVEVTCVPLMRLLTYTWHVHAVYTFVWPSSVFFLTRWA